jgi:catechol 2,3-dioxygenase-like lactoylglutathione lyase family enzyme
MSSSVLGPATILQHDPGLAASPPVRYTLRVARSEISLPCLLVVPPPNTLGLHRVMFAVDDIHDTVARLRAHGAELLGEVAQYESIFLLCYLRGPAGIIVALAEQIG